MAKVRRFVLRVSHSGPFEIRGLTLNTTPVVEVPVASTERELSIDIAGVYSEPATLRWTVLALHRIPALAAFLLKGATEIELGTKGDLAAGDRWRSAATHPKADK